LRSTVAHPETQWIRIPGVLEISIGALADPLSVFMVTVVSCIGALIMLYSLGYMAEDKNKTRPKSKPQVFQD
jgi:NADH-quinone oxidoreductase subunit L